MPVQGGWKRVLPMGHSTVPGIMRNGKNSAVRLIFEAKKGENTA